MKLNVFACRGGYLLSAECMMAPREATETYRPVTPILGQVSCDELPTPMCDQVANDIDEQYFSFVSAEEASNVRLSRLATRRPPIYG